MSSIFKKYILEITDVPDDIINDILSISSLKQRSRGETLFSKESNFSKEIFILDGIIRVYFIDENGNDNTVGFYENKNFISTNTLRNNSLSLGYIYQSLTESSYLEIESNAFNNLMETYPILKEVVHHVKQQEIIRINNRDKCIMGTSSMEKYDNFLKYYPNLIDKVPHYNIASFLGITPVTLSRIRNKK